MATDHDVVVVDIETRPDPHIINAPEWRERLERRIEVDGRLTDPLKIAADRSKKLEAAYRTAALRPATSLVACIGFQLWDDEDPRVLTVAEPTRQYEREVLAQFASAISAMNRPVLVTWNGRTFDVPMLIARAVVHGIELPIPAPRDYRRHVDLRDFFPEGSLSEWCYVLGGSFKDVEGEQLLQLPLPELGAHCGADVKLTAHLAYHTQAVWWRTL